MGAVSRRGLLRSAVLDVGVLAVVGAGVVRRSGIGRDVDRIREWVERSRVPLRRSEPLPRTAPLARPASRPAAVERVTRGETTPRAEFRDPSSLCRSCWRRPAIHQHHVTYKVKVLIEGGDLYSPLNALALCGPCHAGHHLASDRVSLASLRDENYAFAFALLGPAAYDYLRRRYAGDDPRLGAALHAARKR